MSFAGGMLTALTFFVGLSFIEDDYAKAKASAGADKPVVVDLWATWCHACLSMQNYVFKGPALDHLQKKAAFVAIDTEKDSNAAAVKILKPTAWPTFVIVDPKDDEVLARLIGGATSAAFSAFVDEGVAALAAKRANKKNLTTEADAALSKGDQEGAARHYRALLKSSTLSPLSRGRAASSFTYVLSRLHKATECREVSMAEAEKAKGTYYEASLVVTAFDCATQEEKKPTTEQVRAWQQRVRELMNGGKVDLTADDKSDLYASLAQMSEFIGEQAEVDKLLRERLALLEDASKQAKTPEDARTFDAHRVDLYLELNRPDEAIALLSQSEKQAPQDYNPPARLARAYLKKGALPEAAQAIERAKKLVYGPRSAVIWTLEGDIAAAAKKPADAKAAYQRARDLLAKMDPAPKQRLADLDKKIGSL